MPKLNEILTEIVTELGAAKNPYGQPMHAFSTEAFFSSMSRFTRLLFPKANTADRRKVSITVNVDGQTNNFIIGDMITCRATVERVKHVKDYNFQRRLWIACITANRTVV